MVQQSVDAKRHTTEAVLKESVCSWLSYALFCYIHLVSKSLQRTCNEDILNGEINKKTLLLSNIFNVASIAHCYLLKIKYLIAHYFFQRKLSS